VLLNREPKNPGGHAAWSAIICRGADIIWQQSGYCGFGPLISNNVAEYSGVCAVLERLQGESESCLVRGDSKLVVMQLSGIYKVRGGLYLPYFIKAKQLLDPIAHRVEFEWIPREQNVNCDNLSKQVLREMNVQI
jgi:ribonuclease HI